MLYFTDLSHYKLRSRFLWGCLSWHVIGEFRLGLRCRSPNWGLSECELHIAMDGKVSGATLVPLQCGSWHKVDARFTGSAVSISSS